MNLPTKAWQTRAGYRICSLWPALASLWKTATTGTDRSIEYESMACCGSSATTGAVASTRSRQGPPPKLISSKSSKSLYGSQPFGDARSCEIFVEHAVAGFWHCASCGVPKCSHFNAKRCAAVPPPKDHAGPVYQRKGSKRGGSWREREATLVAGKLKLFEVAEGGGPGPHVATCVEIDHWFGTSRPNFEIL